MTTTTQNPQPRYVLIRSILRQLIPNLGTIIVVAAMLLVYNAQAASKNSPEAPANPDVVPGVISYQGTLMDKGTGEPFNGSLDITFRVYSAETGGTARWEEQHTVTVTEGLFHVNLGSITPFSSEILGSEPLYLGVQVESDAEMTPREVIGASPQAIGISDGSVITAKIANAAVTSSKVAPAWYEIFTTAPVDTTSTTYVDVGTSFSFDCDVNCVAFIMHRGLIRADTPGTRVDVRVVIDNSIVSFGELGLYETTFVPVQGFGFENLAAGSHTIKIQFACSQYTPPATCQYYGDAGGSFDRLSVMVFAQEP